MVAIHYPRAAHREEFVSRVQHAAQVMGSAPGCLSADCWLTADGAVVSTAQWETAKAMKASFQAAEAAGVDFTFDDRETQPREIHRLLGAVPQ